MIDIHSHLLPGIDDGAASMEEALALAKVAVEGGITHSMLTPHFHAGRYENENEAVNALLVQFKKKLADEGVALKVAAAGEVRIGPEILDMYARQQLPIIGYWNTKPAILLELPHSNVPIGSEKLAAWLMRHDVQPIIVHPERNKDIIRDLEKLVPLKIEGCLFQVTADSVSGNFGPHAQLRARQLLDRGWVTFLASDAHNIEHRPPVLERGRAAAAEIVGEQEAWRLVRTNPAQLTAHHFPDLVEPIEMK